MRDVLYGCPLPDSDNWRTLTEGGSALTSRAKVFGITSWLSLRSSSTRATKSSRPCASMNWTPADLIFSVFRVRQPLKAPDLIVLSLLKLKSSSRMWWNPEKASGWTEVMRLRLKSTTSACWRPLRVRLDSRDNLLFRTSRNRTWKIPKKKRNNLLNRYYKSEKRKKDSDDF